MEDRVAVEVVVEETTTTDELPEVGFSVPMVVSLVLLDLEMAVVVVVAAPVEPVSVGSVHGGGGGVGQVVIVLRIQTVTGS